MIDFKWELKQVLSGIKKGLLEKQITFFLRPHEGIWGESHADFSQLADEIVSLLTDKQMRWQFLSVCLGSYLLNPKKAPKSFPDWIQSKIAIAKLLGCNVTLNDLLLWRWDRAAFPVLDEYENGKHDTIYYALIAVSNAGSHPLCPSWVAEVLNDTAIDAIAIAAELAVKTNTGSRLFFWPFINPQKPTHDRSLGLPVYLSFLSLTKGKPVPMIVATGEIDRQLCIRPVYGVFDKCEKAFEKGFKKFIYPEDGSHFEHRREFKCLGITYIDQAKTAWGLVDSAVSDPPTKVEIKTTLSNNQKLVTILENTVLNYRRWQGKFVDIFGFEKTSDSLIAWDLFAIENSMANLNLFDEDIMIDKLRRTEPSKITVTQLHDKLKRFVLIGPPGIGKSTTTQYIAFLLAKGCIENKNAKYPFYIELRYINTKTDLISYISKRYSVDIDCLNKLLSLGNMCLLLDGLNEIIEDDLRHFVIREINGLIKYYNIDIIVTSRTYSYNYAIELPIFNIIPLDKHQVDEFISKYTNNSEAVSNISRKLLNNHKLYNLCRNPLILKMLLSYLVSNNNSLPDNKGVLLKTFIFQVYKRELTKNSQFDYKNFHKVFSYIGYKSRRDKLVGFDLNYVYLLAQKILDVNHASINSYEIIRQGLELNILENPDGENISFSHELYQEYFAAEYLFMDKNNGQNIIITELIHLDEWREPVILYSGICSNRDNFIAIISSSNAFLAASCLNNSLAENSNSKENIAKMAFMQSVKSYDQSPWNVLSDKAERCIDGPVEGILTLIELKDISKLLDSLKMIRAGGAITDQFIYKIIESADIYQINYFILAIKTAFPKSSKKTMQLITKYLYFKDLDVVKSELIRLIGCLDDQKDFQANIVALKIMLKYDLRDKYDIYERYNSILSHHVFYRSEQLIELVKQFNLPVSNYMSCLWDIFKYDTQVTKSYLKLFKFNNNKLYSIDKFIKRLACYDTKESINDGVTLYKEYCSEYNLSNSEYARILKRTL